MISVVAVAIIGLIAYIILSLRKDDSGDMGKIPGPKGWPILGNTWLLAERAGWKNQIQQLMKDMHDQYGQVFKLKLLGGTNMVCFIDADICKTILGDNSKFVRSDVFVEGAR